MKQNSKIENVKKSYLDDKHFQYHLKQYTNPYRSTINLCGFIRELINCEQPYKAIDVGCGGGANIYHLSKILPKTSWIGLDWADTFFELSEKFISGEKCEFVKGDFYKLTELFGKNSFDLVFSIQTLSWLPCYEKALKELIKTSRKWIFITSLFTDYSVDVISNVYEYNENWETDNPYFYNVYSLERFKDYCLKKGAKNVHFNDFQIDIDLQPPAHKHMGTYTIETSEKKRLQFSGPLHLPWKFIAIEM